MKQEQLAQVQLLAGQDSKGQQVLEKVEVFVLEQENHYELKKAPMLVRGLAKGDIIFLDENHAGEFNVVKRSGNLAVRVFRKADIEVLESILTPQVEMHEGTLDIQTNRALSYSLHVNLGFAVVEALFDNAMAAYSDSVWYYGNVYDPADGVTPLNWWDSFWDVDPENILEISLSDSTYLLHNGTANLYLADENTLIYRTRFALGEVGGIKRKVTDYSVTPETIDEAIGLENFNFVNLSIFRVFKTVYMG